MESKYPCVHCSVKLNSEIPKSIYFRAPTLTMPDDSQIGRKPLGHFLKDAGYPSRAWDVGEDMGKRDKRGKTETFGVPMAGKIAVVAIAVGALGYVLLSRPATVQPVRIPYAHQALTPPAPAPTPPAPALASAPQIEIPKAADTPGKFVREGVYFVSPETAR